MELVFVGKIESFSKFLGSPVDVIGYRVVLYMCNPAFGSPNPEDEKSFILSILFLIIKFVYNRNLMIYIYVTHII